MLRFLAFCLCFCASAALSHAASQSSTPIDGTIVSTVPVIGLTFDAPVRVITTTVTGPDGVVPITRETADLAKSTFRASPDVALTNGAYAVEWRGLAEDGHVMQGSFSFTVSTD